MTVKLLMDITGYGPKGAFVHAPKGLFRNTWYPRRKADYLSPAEGGPRAIGVVAERDYLFKAVKRTNPVKSNLRQSLEKEQAVDKLRERAEQSLKAAMLAATKKELAATKREMERVLAGPDQAIGILQHLLPPELIFHRKVKTSDPKNQDSSLNTAAATEPAKSTADPSKPELPALSFASFEKAQPKIPDDTRSIFGSVSKSDVAELINTLVDSELNSTNASISVKISADDLSFQPRHGIEIKAAIDGARLRKLGEYDLRINIHGASNNVERIVMVKEQKPKDAKSSA